MIRVYPQTDNVDGLRLPGHGYFNAVDKPYAVFAGSDRSLRQPCSIVMIG